MTSTPYPALPRVALLAAGLACASPPAAAEVAMTPEEFEAYSTGKTIYFRRQGQPYGAEQYLPGRRTIWTFLGGQCIEGFWYAEGGNICFVYEDDPESQCWAFLVTEDGHAARPVSGLPLDDLEVIGETREPLACDGPAIGA